jgi:hypothetical protein
VDKASIDYGEVREQDHPHACMNGWVYLGYVVESPHDLDGEVIEYERLPCRRCAEETSYGS